MKNIQQGDIFMASLNPVKGHEQAGCRPVIVLQNNTLNQHLKTATVAPLTTNLNLKGLMTTHFLSSDQSNLAKDSVIIFSQIRTIDKRRLAKKVGHIAGREFSQLRIQLMRIFW